MTTLRLVVLAFVLLPAVAYADIPPQRIGPADFTPPRGLVELDAPEVTGGLDAASVRMYIRRYNSAIRWCYEKGLATNAKLAGVVGASFEVAVDGEVANVKLVKSTLADVDVEACVRGKIERWRFPAPKDGGTATVVQRFTFKPNPEYQAPAK